MIAERIREKTMSKLSRSFNIEEKINFDGINYDFKGLFLEETSKYILSKDLIYDSFSTKETIFYKTLEKNEKILEENEFRKYITKNLENLKGNKENQMSSVATFVFVGKGLTKVEEKMIKRFSYHKSFLFGLKGWFNIKLVYIDLENKKIISNQYGKKGINFFKNLIIN